MRTRPRHPSAVVVDDRALMRELLRCALDELGVTTASEVSTGQAAIDAAAEHRPEVVILHETAALGGPEVLERIRSASPDLKIIVLTADRAATPPSLQMAADAVVEERAGLESLPSALGMHPGRASGWTSRAVHGANPRGRRWLKRVEGAVSAAILVIAIAFVLPVFGADGRLAAANESLDALVQELPDATTVEAVTLASTLITHRAMLVSEDVDVSELDAQIAEQLGALLPSLAPDVAQALEGVLGHLLLEGPAVTTTVAPPTPAPPATAAPEQPTEAPPPSEPSEAATPSPEETPSPTPSETASPSPEESPSPTPGEPASPSPDKPPDASELASPSPADPGAP